MSDPLGLTDMLQSTLMEPSSILTSDTPAKRKVLWSFSRYCRSFFRRIHVGFRDNLYEGHTGAVKVDERVLGGGDIVSGMDGLACIFLKVNPPDPDLLARLRDLYEPVLRERSAVLGYLVSLSEVRIEVVLPVKTAMEFTLAPNPKAARTPCSLTASRLGVGSVPGKPRHTGHTLVLGGSPNRVEQRQNILLRVKSSTWTSSPIVIS